MLTKIKRQTLAQSLEYHIRSKLLLKRIKGFGEVLLESNNVISEEESWFIKDVSEQLLDNEGYFIEVLYRTVSSDNNEDSYKLHRIYATDRLYTQIDKIMRKIYII